MSHIAGPGGPHDRNGVVVDATGAVLLESIDTCTIAVNGDETQHAVALDLSGRINKTTERSSVLYLFGLDTAALLAADLIGVCARAGQADKLMQLLSRHLGEQL